MAINAEESNVLIFTACYNERDNISRLIEEIIHYVPNADILVVDDNSPDETAAVVENISKQNRKVKIVKRPGKRGIGSAHKYAIIYAVQNSYDYLVTMDADFSHDPASLPGLLASGGRGIFVTGSRYCPGGKSDYSGYRDIVSRLGNIAARLALGVPLKELTTYFRVFDVESLRQIPLWKIDSNGYSYGVQLIYQLRKKRIELVEVPIHFVDRLHGTSKIPKLQILYSAVDLAGMFIRRLFNLGRRFEPDHFVADQCSSCGDTALSMRLFGTRGKPGDRSQLSNYAAYRCTAVGERSHPPIYTCLNCGLVQVPQSVIPPELEQHYSDVIDEQYIQNLPARIRTFSKCMDQIERYSPKKPGRILEVGSYCGLFLAEASKRGWQATGVEPSKWASDYARNVTKVEVHTGFLSENAQSLRKPVDAVVSLDVLEHVRHPVEFLRECSAYLEPGGMLYISTLDTSNWFARLLGRRWPWLMDMHIQYFDIKSVSDVMNRAGFDLINHEPYTHYARVRYALQGASRVFPAFLSPIIGIVAELIPEGWLVPFAFGDIRFYVGRKR